MRRTLPAMVVLFVGWAIAPGCDRPGARSQFETLVGTLVSVQPDTGEMTVQLAQADPSGRSRTALCVVTKNSEVYIDDVVRDLADVRIGDEVEIMVTREPDSRIERFAVVYAHIDRPAAAPPAPLLPGLGPHAAPTGGS